MAEIVLSISIKVCLRCQDEEEVRRFSLERSAGSCVSYKQLVARLEAIFPQLEAAVYRVSWTDKEGDAVTISTDEELGIALAEMTGPVYRLRVTVTGQARQGDNEELEQEDELERPAPLRKGFGKRGKGRFRHGMRGFRGIGPSPSPERGMDRRGRCESLGAGSDSGVEESMFPSGQRRRGKMLGRGRCGRFGGRGMRGEIMFSDAGLHGHGGLPGDGVGPRGGRMMGAGPWSPAGRRGRGNLAMKRHGCTVPPMVQRRSIMTQMMMGRDHRQGGVLNQFPLQRMNGRRGGMMMLGRGKFFI